MARELTEIVNRLEGFTGGVNVRDAVNQLAPDEARIIHNAQLDERGGAGKRLGCVSKGTFDTGADRILSIHTFYRASASPQVIIHTTAGKLYYTDNPGADPVVWTQIATGLSTSAPYSYETFNTKVYLTNGVNDYASWDGATYTTFPSAPKGKFLRLWKDTMWMAGSTPDRVYSSAPGDAETWPVSTWVDIAKGDGDTAAALATDGAFLIFGKKNRAFVIYDPVSFANRVVDFEKGFESHFSIAQFEGQIYYLSRRGICLWLGDSPSRVISEKLDPIFDPNVIALDQLGQATVYLIGNRIGWSIPEAGLAYNSIQVEYYPRLAGVTPYGNRGIGPFVFHRMPTQSFARVRSGASERLYASHNASNKLLEVFGASGTDDGVAFTAIVETKAYDMGEPIQTKYLRRIRLLGRGRFNLYVKRDFKPGIYRTILVDMTSGSDTWSLSDTWGIGTWGPDSILKELEKTNIDAYARFFTFRFEDAAEIGLGLTQIPVGATDRSVTSGEWAIYGMTLAGKVLGLR